jgi:hypothetical protein
MNLSKYRTQKKIEAGYIKLRAIAAEMAITAPTERSTPPVAITSVIPIANNINGTALFKTSIGFPYR